MVNQERNGDELEENKGRRRRKEKLERNYDKQRKIQFKRGFTLQTEK